MEGTIASIADASKNTTTKETMAAMFSTLSAAGA
ncbi:MAG: hypothetical protein ACD_10C00649G0001 [uncultured bacterium]|nr:MAG: hypothetical protein ACD_10C00649G0001 [uncultured bacterium]